MRPKKVILTIGANQIRERILGFMLWNRGYSVVSLHPAIDARLEFPRGIDMVICDQDLGSILGNDLVRSLKAIAPEIPMVLVSHVVNEWPADCAADAFIRRSDSNSALLDTIKVLAQRKRGPRRAADATVPAAVNA